MHEFELEIILISERIPIDGSLFSCMNQKFFEVIRKQYLSLPQVLKSCVPLQV